jgi:hypothetical protein
VSAARVVVYPRDVHGDLLGTGLVLGVDAGALLPGTLRGAIQDLGNGRYSFDVVSASPGTSTIQVSVEGVALSTVPVVDFVQP